MSDTLARGGGWKTEPDKNKENVYVGLIINDEHCIITWLRTLLTPLQDKLSLSVQSSATMSDYFISCLSTRNSAGSDEKLLIGLVCKYLGCPCKIGCYSGVKACIKGNHRPQVSATCHVTF